MNHRDTEVTEGPDPTLNRLSERIIGAAIEVHRCIGPGYLESIYEEAVAVELTLRDVPFTRQVQLPLYYKGTPIGEGRLDLLVGGDIVVELKAVNELLPLHKAQLLSYLEAGPYRLGLLINFNVARLVDGVRRVVL